MITFVVSECGLGIDEALSTARWFVEFVELGSGKRIECFLNNKLCHIKNCPMHLETHVHFGF